MSIHPAQDKTRRQRVLERQVARLERRLAELQATSDRFTDVRTGLALAFLPVVGGAFWFLGAGGWIALVALVIGFAAVIAMHRRVLDGLRRFTAWRDIKRLHLARIGHDCAALPPPRHTVPPPGHPFALDLDMVGARSVHHLLDTAHSREGSARLRDWLLAERPVVPTIQARQALVRELLPLTVFRDKLALHARLAARDLDVGWDGARLLARLEARFPDGPLRATLLILLALAATTAVLFVGFALELLPPLWIGSLLVYGLVYVLRRGPISELFEDALYFVDALRRLGAVLGYLEDYHYGSNTGLKRLCAPLLAEDQRPSDLLQRFTGVASAASLQANPLLWLAVNLLLPWDMIFAYRLNQHKAVVAAHLPAWLDVWYELEALCALATFAYLNPEYTFPEIIPDRRDARLGVQDTPATVQPDLFAGAGLGHPLLPHAGKVGNDFALRGLDDVVIITGSNMSGKSTFLRTVGINAALAYAGGVVNATALRLVPGRLFTAIRVTDSVTDGISYFYAEVKRLKALLDAMEEDGDLPVLFLIDEIFRGTNNRERLLGSR
ncbi:MAG: hypothetical protein JW910_18310, partial [Anaerolineae bacterium]|nr:hypothetical protein [Anaerolineae bacterium]